MAKAKKRQSTIANIINIKTGIFLGIVAMPVTVLAAGDYGLSETADKAGLAKYSASVPDLIGNVLGNVLALVGVLFFGLMVYGGVMWMLARGNEETAKKALNTIIGAIIGLVIIMASYAITTFVFRSVGEQQEFGGVGDGGGTVVSGYCIDSGATTCANDDDCVGEVQCWNGYCHDQSILGDPSVCTSDNDCKSNFTCRK